MNRSEQDYADLIADARVWPRDGVSKGPLINALADAIEALVKERDALAAEVERLKLVHVGQARLAMLAVYLVDVDGDEGTQAFYREWVRNHDAALIESLADDRGVDASEDHDDEWWVGYRQAQREIVHWLTERARQVREGEA